MSCRSIRALVLLLIIVGLLFPGDALADFTVPASFVDQPVVGDVPAPTAIDWLPSGELLIATQGGALFRWNGTGAAQPVLDLSAAVCAGFEMGLLGLAVDPAFSGNGFIYLYYTHKIGDGCDAANRANRVSRFTVAGNGEIDTGSEVPLIDNIAAPGGNHNAGDLQFDRNGFLYVSVGDGGSTPDTARRLDTLNAKILRITRDGGIPATNPYQGSGTIACALQGMAPSGETCQEIYATGLRNPFRFAFDPDDLSGVQRFFINDVGGGAWEEIDAGAPEADYGWPIREGPCVIGSTTDCPQPSGFVEPIYAYDRDEGCVTITGGAFVPNNSNWPAELRDEYLFADLGCGTIFRLDIGSGTATPFATGSGAIHLRFGSDGALYYTTYEGSGQVRRIVSTLVPPPPDNTSPPPSGQSPTTNDNKDRNERKKERKERKKERKQKRDRKQRQRQHHHHRRNQQRTQWTQGGVLVEAHHAAIAAPPA